jgi:hypothetical protein
MKARTRGCLVVVAALSALAAVPAALASDDNGSGSAVPLTGETLLAADVGGGLNDSSSVTGTCNPSGTSTFMFDVTGISVGPAYPGTFTEHGTITMGPATSGFQPVTFQSTFTITSPTGAFAVTGAKSLAENAPAVAFCGAAVSETGDPNAFVFQANVDYTANITTATGNATDSGVSNVDYSDSRVHDVPGANGFAFAETFISTGFVPGGGGGDGDDDDDDDDDDDGGDGDDDRDG